MVALSESIVLLCWLLLYGGGGWIIAGITGVVGIDANGDRNADYSLLDMNPSTGKFEVFRRLSQF